MQMEMESLIQKNRLQALILTTLTLTEMGLTIQRIPSHQIPSSLKTVIKTVSLILSIQMMIMMVPLMVKMPSRQILKSSSILTGTVQETTKTRMMTTTAIVMWMSCCKILILKILRVIHWILTKMVSQTFQKNLQEQILKILILTETVSSMEKTTSHWILNTAVIMMETGFQMKWMSMAITTLTTWEMCLILTMITMGLLMWQRMYL